MLETIHICSYIHVLLVLRYSLVDTLLDFINVLLLDYKCSCKFIFSYMLLLIICQISHKCMHIRTGSIILKLRGQL